MTLVLKLTLPESGLWFSHDIRTWVGEHPEYNNYFDIIDQETISIKVDRVEIGRDESNKIVFNNYRLFSEISGKHALIVRQGGQWFLVDQGSKYGTWLRRGSDIKDIRTRDGPVKLERGDEIMLGRSDNKVLGGPVTLLVASV